MLSKLIKYEFKATGRVFLPMFAILIAMSAVAPLFDKIDVEITSTVIALYAIVMVMLFTAVWVIAIAIIIRRFWVNLLGREGYLMHVLPVSSWQHVASKLITAAVWLIAAFVASLIAILFLSGQMFNISPKAFVTLFRSLMEYKFRGGMILIIVQALLLAFLSCLQILLTVYTAMAVGQLVNRHRVWASIGAYFGLSILCSAVSNPLVKLVFGTDNGFFHVESDGAVIAFINRSLLIANLTALVFSAVFFAASSILLKKKLNLQ